MTAVMIVALCLVALTAVLFVSAGMVGSSRTAARLAIAGVLTTVLAVIAPLASRL